MKMIGGHYLAYFAIYPTEHITLQLCNLDLVCEKWFTTVLLFFSDVESLKHNSIHYIHGVYVLELFTMQGQNPVYIVTLQSHSVDLITIWGKSCSPQAISLNFS